MRTPPAPPRGGGQRAQVGSVGRTHLDGRVHVHALVAQALVVGKDEAALGRLLPRPQQRVGQPAKRHTLQGRRPRSRPRRWRTWEGRPPHAPRQTAGHSSRRGRSSTRTRARAPAPTPAPVSARRQSRAGTPHSAAAPACRASQSCRKTGPGVHPPASLSPGQGCAPPALPRPHLPEEVHATRGVVLAMVGLQQRHHVLRLGPPTQDALRQHARTLWGLGRTQRRT
jgi:hypothetical protein